MQDKERIIEKPEIGFKGFKRRQSDGEVYCYPGFPKTRKVYRVGTNNGPKKGISPCKKGIHYCKNFLHVDNFYDFSSKDNVFAQIIVPKGAIVIDSHKKSVSTKIKIESFHTFEEFIQKYGKKLPLPKSVQAFGLRKNKMFNIHHDGRYKNVDGSQISEIMRKRIVNPHHEYGGSMRGHYYEINGEKFLLVERVLKRKYN